MAAYSSLSTTSLGEISVPIPRSLSVPRMNSVVIGTQINRTHSNSQYIPAALFLLSGFVFKLQANLDPRHRDRLAYIRVVSGRYEKGMKVSHSRSKRQLTLSQAQALFATEREAIVEAFPGDVIGINNPAGLLSIGDALYTGGSRVKFKGIPSFSPEGEYLFLKSKVNFVFMIFPSSPCDDCCCSVCICVKSHAIQVQSLP